MPAQITTGTVTQTSDHGSDLGAAFDRLRIVLDGDDGHTYTIHSTLRGTHPQPGQRIRVKIWHSASATEDQPWITRALSDAPGHAYDFLDSEEN